MRYATEKLEIIKKLCKMYNILYRIKNLHNSAGLAHIEKELIIINGDIKFKKKKEELAFFISTVLHEICHILTARKGKFRVYNYIDPFKCSKKERNIYLQTALRAEVYVDKMAEKLCKRFFPGVRFVKSYRSKRDKDYLNKDLEQIRRY